MHLLHSFCYSFSLRTGAIASLILSVFQLATYLLCGLTDPKQFFNIQSVLLFAIWFVFMLTAFYGIYAESSTFLIPLLTSKVLSIILDIMGVIAAFFKDQIDDKMHMPDLGLQWYIVAVSNPSLYNVLLGLFILTIPLKVYLALVLLSYYLILKEDDDPDATFYE